MDRRISILMEQTRDGESVRRSWANQWTLGESAGGDCSSESTAEPVQVEFHLTNSLFWNLFRCLRLISINPPAFQPRSEREKRIRHERDSAFPPHGRKRLPSEVDREDYQSEFFLSHIAAMLDPVEKSPKFSLPMNREVARRVGWKM
jgi:hypothetical protein